jgi:predicted nucleotidyltransferase
MSQKNDKDWTPLFGKTVFRVAEMVFNFPSRSFHIRMLQKETGLSTTAVKDAVEKLAGYGIILVESTPVTTNIRANVGSEPYTFYKKMFNLYRLERYSFVSSLKKLLRPSLISVYGSFARGEDTEKSDIDLFVVTSLEKGEDVERLENVMEKTLQRKVDLKLSRSLDGLDSEFRNGLANGIVLHGYLKAA